jgi:hypothetical protein
LILAISYILKTLTPLEDWLRWQKLDRIPFPTIPYEDSTYYLSQIREVLDDDFKFGNPLFFEYDNSSYSFGNSTLFHFWGLIGNLFDLNLVQTYLVMVGVNSLMMVIAFSLLLSFLTSKKYSVMISTIVFIVLLEGIGRPSPTQQLLGTVTLIIFLYLKLKISSDLKTYKKTATQVAFYALLTFLVTSNPLYGAFVFIFFLAYDLILERKISGLSYFCGSVNLVYFILNHLQTNNDEKLMALRLGIHETRIPGAIQITMSAIGVLILISYIFGKFRTRLSNSLSISLKIVASLELAFILVTNSQVLTNKAFEMESHFEELYLILSLLFLSAAAFQWNSQVMKVSSIKIDERLILLFSFIALIMSASNSGIIEKKVLIQNNLTKTIQYLNGQEAVVLLKNDREYSVSEKLILLTDSKLYWHPMIVGSIATDKEILHRFACSRSSELSFEDFLEFEGEIFFHEFSNTEMKLSRASRYLPWLRQELNDFKLQKVEKFRNAFEYFKREYDSCSSGNFYYRVDYLFELDINGKSKNLVRK